MALSVSVSPNEYARVAVAAYEGLAIRVSLASVGTSGFTSSSSVADWDSVKLSGNGYLDVTTTVATGGYDSTDGRYELGSEAGANTYVDATFTASGGSLEYDRVYVVLGTDDLHSVLIESPAATLSSGSQITYRIQLAVGS